MTSLDPDLCYAALTARDRRHDGRFFVGVRTTGIYCRPVCPARTPKRENITFYPSAAAAQSAGLRPCLRCRPETAPGTPAWAGTGAAVRRAMRLIDEGALDHGSVDMLAGRLGLGARQLGRLFQQHLGASPVAVAQTRRLLIAKHLLHETDLPVTDIAFAAGFGSLRRFNELFASVFAQPPRVLRAAMQADRPAHGGTITLNLTVRPPYDWAAMLAFWRLRAIAGVEAVDADSYQRTFCVHGVMGRLTVSRASDAALRLTVETSTLSVLPALIARIRRQFDCDADPLAIAASLNRDPMLAALVEARPGLRVPGAFDPFETGLRAILGQQVTVGAAVGLFGQLVGLCAGDTTAPPALSRSSPDAATVAAADLSGMKMPRARIAALQGFARLCADTPDLLDGEPDTVRARLVALPGIGPWTADYIAVRALGDPDGFASGDVALQRVLADGDGNRPDAAALEARSQAWRPWRAYAAQYLWTLDALAV
ncbi:MAG: helix-turn-helix domain-containing protein [Hyphomonadaceae bacterium]|nr:helix-turn-helix domain-containing protein [Hyphomonadaceae bacterium]